MLGTSTRRSTWIFIPEKMATLPYTFRSMLRIALKMLIRETYEKLGPPVWPGRLTIGIKEFSSHGCNFRRPKSDTPSRVNGL
ncbi:hypothetical protein WAI453_003564 [Rhynchosporium graminicola]